MEDDQGNDVKRATAVQVERGESAAEQCEDRNEEHGCSYPGPPVRSTNLNIEGRLLQGKGRPEAKAHTIVDGGDHSSRGNQHVEDTQECGQAEGGRDGRVGDIEVPASIPSVDAHTQPLGEDTPRVQIAMTAPATVSEPYQPTIAPLNRAFHTLSTR